jgi:U5 small nuclear ribonucleoprotein component
MDEDLYDEFGNYIGPDLESDNSDIEDRGKGDDEEPYEQGENSMVVDEIPVVESRVVLHEDKSYYPSAHDVFGKDVQVIVQEEDTQPLTEPIIKPIKTKSFQIVEKDLPETIYKKEYIDDLMRIPERVRNVAIVGSLGHGKTAFLDNLVIETHPKVQADRYTDTHHIERDRGCSIKCSPISLVLESSKYTNYLLNLVDTPGHVNFFDEAVAAVRLVDGVVIVVDIIEGLTINTESLIVHCATQNIPMVLAINKLDRLVLELRLPPIDSYFKLKLLIDQANSVMKRHSPSAFYKTYKFSPQEGNVIFSSALFGFCFSLESFANMYFNYYGINNVDAKTFSKKLWGDYYYNKVTRKFTIGNNQMEEDSMTRAFIHFVLEPIYKLFSQGVGEEGDELRNGLATVDIYLNQDEVKLDVQPLLGVIFHKFFGNFQTCFVDTCVQHLPNPVERLDEKLSSIFEGSLDNLLIHVTKIFPSEDATKFFALGRVFSGAVKKGQSVKVLGENYTVDDEEDMTIQTVESISVCGGRYKFSIDEAVAGSLVLLGGVDSGVIKTCTIVENRSSEEISVFKPLKFSTQPVMKIAVEPINPAELPKMIDGLRKVNKTYPIVQTKVEESGEHILLGTGELYLDCVLHDLRKLYSEIEIKVSDPVVKFCETVVETSSIKCFAETPNKKNKITMICEPLEKGLAESIENSAVSLKLAPKIVSEYFKVNYDWDALAARSIWAFGPDEQGPNILLDDTLPSEVDKKLLFSLKESMKQGFQWAVREGPLCDERKERTSE